MIDDKHLDELIERYPALAPIQEAIAMGADAMKKSIDAGGKILVCGNGGSAADADHIVGELMKSFVKKRPIADSLKQALLAADAALGSELADSLQGGIPAISLTQHTALSTAFANDVDPHMTYAQQTVVLGNANDIFIGISTSGNAKNVRYAAICAKAKGLTVIGLTGESGGKLKALCDICITVPETATFKVQELHLPVYHTLCLMLEEHCW